MPADRLSLAVGVGREDQFVVVFQGVGDGFDVLAGIIPDFPFHCEIVFRIDRSVLGRQIANVPVRGQNGIVIPQVFIDGFGLGWGFDNDDGHVIPLDSSNRANGGAKEGGSDQMSMGHEICCRGIECIGLLFCGNIPAGGQKTFNASGGDILAKKKQGLMGQ